MKKILEIFMVFLFFSIGILISIYSGINYGFKGYFLGALVGFGGCVAFANVVCILLSKFQSSHGLARRRSGLEADPTKNRLDEKP